ncbi:hypothetical protein EF405_15430 [Cyclobacteriaceae bacterium YHN15]|jgi:hypothetical protein|nr:hypothetical protein EF405_15430 [Cyclobacteriaceae bacterium YHN15]
MKDPKQDLAEIKSMMERSSRFLSLSGMSGVLAGFYALIGATMAYYWLYFPNPPFGDGQFSHLGGGILTNLILTGLVVLSLSIVTAWILSEKKSKRTSNQLWTPAGKRFIQSLFFPVTIGGLFCFALLHQGFSIFIPSTMLIFYGLGLLNASHFTLNDIKYLGYGQAILGIIASFFPAYGLVIWALGFGVLHIIYGSMMYLKYDK